MPSTTAACPACSRQVPLTPRTQVISAHDAPDSAGRCAGGGRRPLPAAMVKPERTAVCRHCTHAIAVAADGRMLQHWARGGTCPGSRRKVLAAEPAQRRAGEAAAPSTRAGAGTTARGVRTAVAVLLAVAVGAFVLTRGEEPGPGVDSAAAAPAVASDPVEPAPSPDTSVPDALAAAGLPDALITRLGAVAYRTGYTLSTSQQQVETIAYMQLLTCREVQSGYRTWSEILAADVADGAPSSSARTMLEFLRSDYCPAVRSADGSRSAEPAPGAASVRADGSDAHGMRGLLSEPAYLDAAYPAVAVGRCATVVGPDEALRAYELPSKALLCVTPASHPNWRNHVINADVVFETPVDVARALAVARTVLPGDVAEGRRRPHVNPPHAPAPGGCLGVELRTAELGRYFRTFDKPQEPGAVALLYTGKQTTDGASAPFDPASVQQVSLTVGEIDPALDGGYYC